MLNNRLEQKSKRSRKVFTQPDDLQLQVQSAIAFFEPCEANQSPEISTSLISTLRSVCWVSRSSLFTGGVQHIGAARMTWRSSFSSARVWCLSAEWRSCCSHANLVGWSKATDLVKVARREREQFGGATWLRKATEFRRKSSEREKNLTGQETEPLEIIYKVFAVLFASLSCGTIARRGYSATLTAHQNALAGGSCRANTFVLSSLMRREINIPHLL
jgi:hypothetical protein